MDTENINFIALQLDQPSKDKLISLTKNKFGEKYKKICCDHITLAYGRDQVEKFNQLLFEQIATMHAFTIVYDDHAAALVIDKAEIEKFGVNNQYPHITLAVNDVRPVYSNQLLQNFRKQGEQGERIVAFSYTLKDGIILNASVVPVLYSRKQISESYQVGYKRRGNAAIITEPGESPNTFNGQNLSEIRSPSGAKIKYKFFTSKGSEYIMSENNESRRIKSDKIGDNEGGIWKWYSKIFFIPDQGMKIQESYITDSQFYSAILRAGANEMKVQIVLEGTNLVMYAQNKSGGDFVKIYSIDQIPKRKMPFTKNPPNNIILYRFDSNKPLSLKNISLDPIVGYQPFEVIYDKDGKTETDLHCGDVVSYIEKRDERTGLFSKIKDIGKKIFKH